MKIKHLKYYLLLSSFFLSKFIYAAGELTENEERETLSNLQLKEYGVFIGAITVAVIMIAVFILIKKISEE